MNSNLKCDTLRIASSESWISKTYSEYLMTCAENKLKLMNAISDACYDEELETSIDSVSDAVAGFMDRINEVFNQRAQAQHFPLTAAMERNSQYWKDAALTLFEEDDPAATDLATVWRSEVSGDDSVITIINKIATMTPDSIMAEAPNYLAKIDTKTTNLLSELGYPDGVKLSFTDGYIPASTAIKKVLLATTLNTTEEMYLPAVDSGENTIEPLTMSLDSFWNELKSQYASTICWAEGFAAAAIPNVSDRLASFTSNIQSFIVDATAKWATSVQHVKSMISGASTTLRDFMDMAEQELGWGSIIETDTTIASTDVAAYTGVSPLSDVDLHTAKGVASAVVKTVAAAGKAIFNGLKSLAQKIWKKAKPFVMAVTANPIDLGVINDKAESYTVENWCYTWTNRQVLYECSGDYKNRLRDSQGNDTSLFTAIKGKVLNKWFAYNNYFGEHLMRVTALEVVTATINGHTGWYLRPTFDYQFKPRCVDTIRAADAGLLTHQITAVTNSVRTADNLMADTVVGGDQYTIYPTDAFKRACQNMDLYQNDASDEQNLFLGLMGGVMLSAELAQTAAAEVFRSSDHTVEEVGEDEYVFTNTGSICGYTFYAANPEGGYTSDFNLENPGINILSLRLGMTGSRQNKIVQDLTNRDFLKVASGYYPDAPSEPRKFNYFPYTTGIGSSDWSQVDLTCYIPANFIYILLMQAMDKIYNPADFVFIPYSSDNYTWEDARFQIKTDAQNLAVADTILSAITIVVVVVLAVVVCKAALSFLKKRKFAKLNAKKGKIDNAMWNYDGNGYLKLSTADSLKYARYTRKLNKMNSASSGMVSGGSLFESISSGIQSIQGLVSNGQNSPVQSGGGYESYAKQTNLDANNFIYYELTRSYLPVK